MAEINEKLPPGAALDPDDVADISKIALMVELAFHAPDPVQIREAIDAALSTAPAGADPAQLKQLALEGLVRGYGHRSKLIDLQQPRDDDVPATPAAHPPPDDVDRMRIATIAHFHPANWETPDDCRSVLDPLLADGLEHIDAMVLDLRGNNGGSLAQIACVASPFVEPGTAFLQVDLKNADSRPIFVPASPVPAITLPLVILIDNTTDSGGMLFAASMQSLKRAKLVGTQKTILNGDLFNQFDVVPQRYQIRIPTGSMRRADRRPLTDGVDIDVSSRFEDPAEILRAVRAALILD